MSYSVEDLLVIFRREVDDTVEDYLWSDDDFYLYLDEAQKEFCRETDILKLSGLSIPVIATEAFVDLPSNVIKIRSVVLVSTNKELPLHNYVELRQRGLDSITDNGTPTCIVADEATDQLRLLPIPIIDDSLQVTVYRLPTDIVDDGSALTITDSSHQRSLLMMCKAMAYEVHDSDTQDIAKAERYKTQFYQYARLTKSRRNRRNRKVGTVRYGGL